MRLSIRKLLLSHFCKLHFLNADACYNHSMTLRRNLFSIREYVIEFSLKMQDENFDEEYFGRESILMSFNLSGLLFVHYNK